MRGRKIFRRFSPVWRSVAHRSRQCDLIRNESGFNCGGKNIPAGSYTLFSLPTQTKWTLIVSKQTGEFGIPYPGENNFDFARLEMKLSKLPSPLENFTISFDQTGASCAMRLDLGINPGVYRYFREKIATCPFSDYIHLNG